MTEGLRRMSYFQTLNPHAEWALCLKPGDKVLTNWSSIFPEYASELPWQINDPEDWAEVTIRRSWRDKHCGSGVLVSLKELPDCREYNLDSYWIKPLEAN